MYFNKTLVIHSMLSQITSFINEHKLIKPDDTIVLGLSGGPDSVFLLTVLCALRKDGLLKELIAGHLDHQWRQHSAQDVIFCSELAKTYDVKLVSTTLSDLPLKDVPKGSKEEQGRIARRFFLSRLAEEHCASSIALAHHQDDQQETFFIRLIRGASLAGLTSMYPREGQYIRPLLSMTKQDIITYLDDHHIPYLTDPSNYSEDFLRNRIRMSVIPALRMCDNRFDQSFSRTLSALQETEHFLEQHTREVFHHIAGKRDGVWFLDCKKFRELHAALQYRVLVMWLCEEHVAFPVSKGFFNEMTRFMLSARGGIHALHPTWSLVKQRDHSSIRKNDLQIQ